jgi:hypothetical protein
MVRAESSWRYELHAKEEPLRLNTYWKLSCDSWIAKLTRPAAEATALSGSAIGARPMQITISPWW